MHTRTVVLCLGLLIWTSSVAAATGPPCEDYLESECMSDPMCQADGSCEGTPLPNGTPCTNECANFATCLFGACIGVPVPNGKPCEFPGTGVCFEPAQCVFGFCLPGALIECPSPSDPCKRAFCNPESGQCEEYDKCNTFSGCQTCAAGACVPVNEGGACNDYYECTKNDSCLAGDCGGPPNPGVPCDDYNECTTDDRCQPEGYCSGVPVVGGGPTPTPTGPVPTPTVGPPGCVGDCNDDGDVTVDEILTMVNIALGNAPVDDCPAADANGDGQVTVDEILTAVNYALNGCPIVT